MLDIPVMVSCERVGLDVGMDRAYERSDILLAKYLNQKSGLWPSKCFENIDEMYAFGGVHSMNLAFRLGPYRAMPVPAFRLFAHGTCCEMHNFGDF